MNYFILYKAKYGKQKLVYKIPIDEATAQNLDNHRHIFDEQAWEHFRKTLNSDRFLVFAVRLEESNPFSSSITPLKIYGQRGSKPKKR
jgi:hypothetical protein